MSTFTISESSTYTEARARVVMRRVLTDLIAICQRGILAEATAVNWVEQLKYCLGKEAIEYFELQFTPPGGTSRGIRYEVSDDGSLFENSAAGGLDFFSLPKDTKVGLVIKIKESRRHAIADQIAAWGWGTNGSFLSGAAVRDKAYSKEGYGVVRKVIGAWQ